MNRREPSFHKLFAVHRSLIMSARRIARELAVIIMPQLPKEKKQIDRMDFDTLLCRSVQILTEHARQCLSEAGSYLTKAHQEIGDYELNHPQNRNKIADLKKVPFTTEELRKQVELIEISMHLISEALDIPEMTVSSDHLPTHALCEKCGHNQKILVKRAGSADVKQFLEQLLAQYFDNRERIDQIISTIKTKWRMERMISIDRDILRLACTEAFFMPDVPMKVVINEAVELAHRFADERAAKFINGVLADIREDAEQFRLTGELKLSTQDNDGDRSVQSEPVGR